VLDVRLTLPDWVRAVTLTLPFGVLVLTSIAVTARPRGFV